MKLSKKRTELVLFGRAPAQKRDEREEPECFLEDLLHVGKFLEVLAGDVIVRSYHRRNLYVNLLLQHYVDFIVDCRYCAIFWYVVKLLFFEY